MQGKPSVFNRLLPGLVLVLASVCTVPASLAQYVAAMETVESETLRNNVAVGQSLQLNNVLLDGESTPVTLTLERFEVFAPDAQIVVHGPNGEDRLPAPTGAYFKGTISGQPDSLAVLSAHPQGTMRGIAQYGGKFWIMVGGREANGPLKGLASRELRRSGQSDQIESYQCHIDQLPKALRTPRPLPQAMPQQPLAAGQLYDVRIAIETDGEFFNLFGNATAATAYIGDLFAYASTIYQREASAKLTVGDVSLWSGGAASDPWNHTSTDQGLTSFQNYWNTNKKSVSRATAHFLSARKLGGGVAYVGALCDQKFGYGYSAEIDGHFQLANPQPVWDIIVVSHEIGHNFNSSHTHCYAGIGGNGNPVDGCYSKEDGCWNGAESLPGVNSLTGGTPGAGDGTIMSYCHVLGGGTANISLTFGQNHSRGMAPSRVSSEISSYVAATASANPSCITISGGASSYTLTLATAGTGSGTVSGAGVYAAGATVNLTATANSGSTFAGWNPSPCASSFAMPTSALTCTATFTLTQSALPDLVISSVTSPPTSVAGEALQVTAAVINQGTAAAGPFKARYYLSLDSTLASNDISTTYACSYDALAPGASRNCNGQIKIPATVSPGTYYLGMYADPDNTVSESAEDNNGKAAANTITVTGGSAATYTLTLAQTGSGTVTGQGSYAAGATVNLTATPVSGSTFAGWSPSPCASSFTMPASNLTCTATFSVAVGFNEEYYLANNPDVAQAVRRGELGTGWRHYQARVLTGLESRSFAAPYTDATFNEEYYLANNPDVAMVVEQGLLGSGWAHYQTYGAMEGRSFAKPYSGVAVNFNEEHYLANNPDVAQAVRRGELGTGWRHYQARVLTGLESRSFAAPYTDATFNEEYYLANNPDVAMVVEQGLLGSGWAHYQTYGAMEGRSFAKPY